MNRSLNEEKEKDFRGWGEQQMQILRVEDGFGVSKKYKFLTE